jgi:gliding motility-associated-like protein
MKKIIFAFLCLFSPICAFSQPCPVTVEAHVVNSSELLKEDEINEFDAPVEIRFDAINTSTTAGYNWKIVKIDPSSGNSSIVSSPNQSSYTYTYTFKESGRFQVQLEVTPQSTCDIYFDISIDEADLKLPNVFTPNGNGSNDTYRVSCKSIVRFKVSIYNRWGKLLYSKSGENLKEWEGWDGKVGGKVVPTGVYFIIVDAEGADGKVYKLSKDINVLR